MENSEPFFSRNNGVYVQLSSLDKINESDEKSLNESRPQQFSRESSTSSSCLSYINMQRKDHKQHQDFSDQNSSLDDTSFYQDLQIPNEIETAPSCKENKTPQNDDLIIYENPNPDFEVWDFHPNELEPQATFTYSTHLENLRLSLNTFLKKPIKQPFSINTKKALVSVNKGESSTIDDHFQFDDASDFDHALQREYSTLISGKHMTKRKNYQLQQSQLVPFYKTKKFRRITNIYYHVDPYNKGLSLSHKVKDRKTKRQNIGSSPRKNIGMFHIKVTKKRSTLLLKQSYNNLSITNVTTSNTLASPNVKQGLNLQNQATLMKPITSQQGSPESNKMSRSQKPMTNDKVMTRRVSGSIVRNTSPESLDQQIARYKFNEKKYQKNTQQIPYVNTQYMHISKRNSNELEPSSMNKQFPMIRFENPALTIKVENFMQSQTKQDQKILDMLTNLYSKNQVNQIEKCQLQSQYYNKRMSDMTVTHKQSMNERIDHERNSLVQSRLSQKDFKEEVNFINSKTFTNFQALYKRDFNSKQDKNCNIMSLPYIQNVNQSTNNKDSSYQSQRNDNMKVRNPQEQFNLPSSTTARRNHFQKQ